ncbi:MAG: hypothetical protein KAT54_04610, partial [Candidatus Marinimicrobia bacterium]|nr:hypothetical protein [Candidatus Neomarinimicrobiota bacterium]
PMNFEIVSGDVNPNNNPMRMIIIKTTGSIFNNDLKATLIAFFVFPLSLKNDTMRQSKTKEFMKIAFGFIS